MKGSMKVAIGVFLAVIAGLALSQVPDILAQWASAQNAANQFAATPSTGNGAVKLRSIAVADLPAQITTGSPFTITSGCATTSALTGGQNAGSFATTTTGTCTPVIALPPAPHSWFCQASNITHPVVFTQTATSANSCTVSGATTSGDTVLF